MVQTKTTYKEVVHYIEAFELRVIYQFNEEGFIYL